MRSSFVGALLLLTLPHSATAQDRIAAYVNGKPVWESRIMAQYTLIPSDLTQGREIQLKKQILEKIIDQEVVYQESVRLQVDRTAEFQANLQMETAQLNGDPKFREKLEEAELRLRANAVIADSVGKAVTTDAMRTYYAWNKNNFAFPAVRASHIMVATEGEARSLLKTLTSRNFAETARRYSKAPSGSQGGEMGWFSREAMVPAFSAVAFNTPPGTIARTLIPTDYGWHIILVWERNDWYVPPFEQVEPQIRMKMAEDVINDFLPKLRSSAVIKYQPPFGN